MLSGHTSCRMYLGLCDVYEYICKVYKMYTSKGVMQGKLIAVVYTLRTY